MGDHSFENITEELEGSGLIDVMYPQYQMLLTCMAEMADASGGREFPATHIPNRQEIGRLPSWDNYA